MKLFVSFIVETLQSEARKRIFNTKLRKAIQKIEAKQRKNKLLSIEK